MNSHSREHAYIARLWERPRLCVALFGLQVHTEKGRRLYAEARIDEQLDLSLTHALQEGSLLLNRPMESSEGRVWLQYWSSYEDLAEWARAQPHAGWWRWLIEHAGPDLSFYHEIYQAKTAEAIFERGCKPVGPAVFCEVAPVSGGEGRSRDRQEQFAAAALHHSAPRD